ncbi:DegT/DnrJ/EryC1/StrS family aminotransferase [Candidatus Thioglobus sp.]|nr:DegT/DnrJ/EryC1/StrS family aminotransferase [Candidatus Thioglobus sp.]
MTTSSWRFQGNERKYLEEVLASGFRAGADGAFTTRFEKAFANAYGVPYGVAFNSGTTTMHAALLAMGCGPGDEILTPALTPLMCGLAPYYTGATPVYVDSLPNTFLMDPQDIERKVTPKTKVIIVTHMYGGVCDMQVIMTIAKKHNLMVLEDCAQCHMGRDGQNRLAGTIGDAGSWSFENSKQLTCGDGGIITCHNEALATKIRKIGGLGFKTLSAESGKVRTDRDKLQNPDWERFDEIGFNYRMNQMAAAVALAQMERADYFITLRRTMGLEFTAILDKSSLLSAQFEPDGYFYTYYTFSAKFNGAEHGVSWADFRKKFMEFGGDGMYAASKLLHQEPAFRDRKIGWGETPVVVDLQKKLMNFTTNQANAEDRAVQIDSLRKTLSFYGDTFN